MAKSVVQMNEKYIENLRKQRVIATGKTVDADKAFREADAEYRKAMHKLDNALTTQRGAYAELALVDSTLEALGATK